MIHARLGMLMFMIVVGFAARKLRVFDENAHKPLGAIVFNISLPFMVFCSISSTLTLGLLKKAGIMFIVSLCSYTVCILLSIFYAKMLRLKEEEKGLHQYGFIFSNVAFIGIPLVNAFWGNEWIIYVSVFNIAYAWFNHSIGIALLSKKREKGDFLQIFKSFPFWSSMLGILFRLLGVRIPEFIFSPMQMIRDMTTPLAMLYIGHTLANTNIIAAGKNKKLYITILFRLVILPAACFLILRSIFDDYYVYSIPTLLLATPFPATLTIFAGKQESNVELASFAMILSVICSMITIPIWAIVLT